MSNAFNLDGNENLSVAEQVIVDHLFIQSNEAPITIATNEHLFERVPKTITVHTREELASLIREQPAAQRAIVVRRLGGMLVGQLESLRQVIEEPVEA